MSLSREELSQEKRNAIKLKFFDSEKTRYKKLEDECKVDGAVLLGGSTVFLSAGLFLSGTCTSSLLFIPPIVLGYYGNKLGTSVAKCLFKENTDPSDDDLLEFEERNKNSMK